MCQAKSREIQRRIRSARAIRSISFAVFLSRLLGLVREQVFAKLFGAGFYMDAYNVAFRIPNLLRDLFAEGVLSSAFVPTFTETLRKQGKIEAWRLANFVISSLLLLLGLFTLVLLFLSDASVYMLAAGFSRVPGKIEITSRLVQILSPFLIFVAVSSVLMGMLNTLNRYFIPALSPVLFNAAIIFFGIIVVPWFEFQGSLAIYAMALGSLVGGALQCAFQIPVLFHHGYRFQFCLNFRHEGVRRIGRLMAPALVGISAVQINVLVNTGLASFLGDEGPVSWLNFAFRIIYLPIGLFGVAVGVVNLREVSISAAQEKWEELKGMVAHSVKSISLMAVPSTVGLLVLAHPIVRLIFERGEFTSVDTQRTADALMCYSLGLFAYSCVKVYAPTFYALGDTRTPVRSSIIAVVTNLGVNLLLIWILPSEYKYLGLALGTAISVWVNTGLLVYAFERRVGQLESYRVVTTLAKNLLASVIMGGAIWSFKAYGQVHWSQQTLVEEVVALFGCIGVGIVLYLGCSRFLGVEEVRYLFTRQRS